MQETVSNVYAKPGKITMLAFAITVVLTSQTMDFLAHKGNLEAGGVVLFVGQILSIIELILLLLFIILEKKHERQMEGKI